MNLFSWYKADSAPAISRRRLFSAGGGFGLFCLIGNTRAHVLESQTVDQPPEQSDNAFIERAFQMRDRALALGDQAYGAAVVRNGRIIGESWSRVILDQDPTAHAEMSAVRDAARREGANALTGAILYSSSPPCSMCQAAANWVGIGKMIYGRDATDGGPPRNCG
jgi:tRNA(Arg) A34 adenosine deaminase TadA